MTNTEKRFIGAHSTELVPLQKRCSGKHIPNWNPSRQTRSDKKHRANPDRLKI